MKGTRLIVAGTAILCLAVLTVWVYARRTVPDNSQQRESEIRRDPGDAHASGPDKKPAIDPRIFALPVDPAILGDGTSAICYVDSLHMILYPWKGIVLNAEQWRAFVGGPYSGRRLLKATDFTAVTPIDAPVKYRQTEEGYRPGHLDPGGRFFFQWKGIILVKKEDLLDKSQDGQAPLVDPRSYGGVFEIDVPAHLKAEPELWKKGGAYDPEAADRAVKSVAEKKEAEQKAAEKRAQEPRVYQLPVRITVFGENDHRPSYSDRENKSLYAWKGVVLRSDQIPKAYDKIPMFVTQGCTIGFADPPVNYREVNGQFRPGYLERSIGVFYEWKGVVLDKREVPDKSKDDQPAIVAADKIKQVIEIDMPAHLKKQPKLWKKP